MGKSLEKPMVKTNTAVRKTAEKTAVEVKLAAPSPLTGHRLPVGAHPGNTGGKKGRSGRKSNKFIEKCVTTSEDPALWEEAKAKHPLGLLTLSANYAQGKPKEKVEISGPDGGPIEQVWRFGNREIVF